MKILFMSGNVYFNGKRFGKVNLEYYKFSERRNRNIKIYNNTFS